MADWGTAELAELAELNPESLGASTPADFRFRYIDLSSVSRGVIDWQQTQPMTFLAAPSRARRLTIHGDVLFGTVRPALQSHSAVRWRESEPLVASTGFAVLRGRQGKADGWFLAHYCLSELAAGEARRAEVGSNYPAVNESDVARFRVPFPPLPEQRQIAEILDTLDEAIRKTDEIIAKLKQVKQGLLHDLLTRGIDDNGELRDPHRHPEQFKDSPLGRIPKGWEVEPANSVCSLITKGTTPSKAEMWQGDGGVPFLRVDNLTFDGALNLTASRFRVSWRTHTEFLARSRVYPGDVLTNIVGPPLGKIALVTASVGEVNVNQAIALFRPTAEIASEYLLLWLADTRSQHWLRRRAKQTSGQVNLTLALCQGLPVPIPKPAEQQMIVRRLLNLQARLDGEQATLAKLRLARQGLSEDLLTGRVRVLPLLNP